MAAPTKASLLIRRGSRGGPEGVQRGSRGVLALLQLACEGRTDDKTHGGTDEGLLANPEGLACEGRTDDKTYGGTDEGSRADIVPAATLLSSRKFPVAQTAPGAELVFSKRKYFSMSSLLQEDP
eukprot:1175372-Prorocentrum_minimum.AAC.2